MFTAEECAIEVGSQYGVPILECGVFRVVGNERALEAGNAGVVHQNVELAVILEDGIDDGNPLGLLPNIEVAISGRGTEGIGEVGSLGVLQITEDDESALCHKSAGDSLTNARSRSGDESNFAR